MGRFQHVSAFCAAIFLSLCALPQVAVGGATDELVTPDELWLSETRGLIRYGFTAPSFEIENPRGYSALDTNNTTPGVWALSKGSLYRYGSAGEVLVEFGIGHGANSAAAAQSHFVVNGHMGTVWVAVGTYLKAYSLNGQLLHVENFHNTIEAIGLWGAGDQVIIALSKELLWVDPAGSVLRRVSVGQRHNVKVTSVAIESTTGAVWVGATDALRRYDASGKLDLEVNGVVERRLSSAGFGSVWAESGGNRLRRYGADGAIEVELYPFSDDRGSTRHIRDIQAKAVDGSVWVISEERLSKYSIVGGLLFDATPVYKDGEEHKFNQIVLAGDTIPPLLEFTQPVAGSTVATQRLAMQLSVSDVGSGIDEASFSLTGTIGISDVLCEFSDSAILCASSEELPEGDVTLTATIADQWGNQSEPSEITFTIDVTAPIIDLKLPSDPWFTNENPLQLLGSLSEEAELTINGEVVPVNNDFGFSAIVELVEGHNTVTVYAVDDAENITERTFTTILDSQPPDALTDEGVAFQQTEEGIVVSGQVPESEMGGQLFIYNLNSGVSYQTVISAGGAFSLLIAGALDERVSLTLQDRAGNRSAPLEMSIAIGGRLPPDPVNIAPELSALVSTPFHEAISFLYQADNPTQTNVDPDAFIAEHVGVIKGRVLKVSGAPLPGVRVSIHNHPEYGETLSRIDGEFDLVVNGGDRLVVNYEKTGYLPAQRSLVTQWNEYVGVDEVALVTFDPVANTVQLPGLNQYQVAQGSEITDVGGTRQATILFPPGTTAAMILADGSTESLEGPITVRATEYTRREAGLESMPAPLPMYSGYTYAVELSIDRAVSAGARRVDFNQDLPLYVDNFLGFPVGSIVPVGYYDFELASWVPSANGRVINILVSGNEYKIDLDGDTIPESTADLEAFGIGQQEIAMLAGIFPHGGAYWRVNISHFTPWDTNWPYLPPEDAEMPTGCDDQGDCVRSKPLDFDNPNIKCGSIIECENQVLGESVAVTGTDFSLDYRSGRMGALGGRITIPLTDSSVPESLRGVVVRISIAGQTKELEFPAQPNLTYEHAWDGKDAYGRLLNGAQSAYISIGYRYENIYWVPDVRKGADGWDDDITRAFGNPAILSDYSEYVRGGDISFSIWNNFTVDVGQYRASDVQGMGGWSFSPLHAYDYKNGKLWKGDGTQRSVVGFNNVHARYAGNGQLGRPVDGVSAVESPLLLSEGLAINGTGDVFISTHRRTAEVPGIYRVDSGGAIHQVVTAPNNEYFGSLALTDDSNLLVVQKAQHTVQNKYGGIYVVDPSGELTRIAGIRSAAGAGTGQADAVSIWPKSIVTDSQGNIYFTESSKFIYTGGYYYGYSEPNCRIKKLSKDGRVSLVGGDGVCEERANIPSSALDMSFNFGGQGTYDSYSTGQGLAVDSNDNLYVAEQYRVLKISPDGTLSKVVDAGEYDFNKYSGEYLQSDITSIAIDNDDKLYVAQGSYGYGAAISKLKDNGELERLAGLGVVLPGAAVASAASDGSPALALTNSRFTNLATSPSGDVFVIDGLVVRRIGRNSPIFSDGDILVPSNNGQSIFVFEPNGRHQRTLNAMSLAEEHSFSYDSSGLLLAIEDSHQNITTIERDSDSNPTAIVSPGGQRTTLNVDGYGYLASIANPAGESYRAEYTEAGLMTRFEMPRGNATTSQYDEFEYLTYHADSVGGSWSIERMSDREVSLISGLGRTTEYRWNYVEDIALEHTTINPDGTSIWSSTGDNGLHQRRFPDGTTVVRLSLPDARFGMTAPIESKHITMLPRSELKRTISTEQSVVLADATENLLRLESSTDSVSINGKLWETKFDASLMRYRVTSPEGRISSSFVDDIGMPVSSEMVGLAPTVFHYDEQGRLSSASLGTGSRTRTVQYSYYDTGHQNRWLQSVENALGQVTQFAYDQAGRITQKTLPDGGRVKFSYDENGNLLSLTPPGRSPHLFAYTDADQKEFYAPPELPGEAPDSTRYVYNIDKDLEIVMYPSGRSVDYIYDAPGAKLSSMDYGTDIIDVEYHPTTGQLNGVSTSSGQSISYQYDGPLIVNQTQSGDVPGQVDFGYNADFNLTSISVNGDGIILAYDDDGLLVAAGDLSLSRDVQNGLITGSEIGLLTSSWEQNEFAEPVTTTTKFDDQVIYHGSYVRDGAGRITQKAETVLGHTHTLIYNYDSVGRLVRVTKDGQVSGTYEYSDNGNRLSGNGRMGEYDEQDRLISYGSTMYSYDLDGYLSEKSEAGAVTRYRYDVLGNLRNVALPGDITIDYIIDGQGRRVGKKVNGSLTQGFLYLDQLNPIAVLDGDGAVVSRFVYAKRLNAPDYMIRDGATYRIVTDQLGSIRLVVNTEDGSIAQHMDYDEFGNVIVDTNPGFQPFGYAGGLYDLHTGLVRFGMRDYDSDVGRWTAKDPIGFDGGDSNIYAYVSNNPINFIDPEGLQGYDLAPNFAPDVNTKVPNQINTEQRSIPACIGECAIRFLLPSEADAITLITSPFGPSLLQHLGKGAIKAIKTNDGATCFGDCRNQESVCE